MQTSGSYEGKTALVTGGGSGIGQSVVEAMAREGARVVFSDNRDEAGRLVEEQLRGEGLDVHFRLSDSTDDSSVRALYEDITSTFGGLQVVVNNVGALVAGEAVDMNIEEMTVELFTAGLHQNLTSCFLGTKYAVQWMKANGGGAIANTASLAGIRYSATTPSYVAAKAGIVHFTRYVAVGYAKHRIRVNAVAPGMTATRSMMEAFPDPDYRREFVSRFQPSGRLIEASEIAAAFLWLCSDKASGVTGHTIPVDDGWAAT